MRLPLTPALSREKRERGRYAANLFAAIACKLARSCANERMPSLSFSVAIASSLSAQRNAFSSKLNLAGAAPGEAGSSFLVRANPHRPARRGGLGPTRW